MRTACVPPSGRRGSRTRKATGRRRSRTSAPRTTRPRSHDHRSGRRQLAPGLVDADRTVARDEAARQTATVEPRRAGGAEQERCLRRHVGDGAALRRYRHVTPRRVRRGAGERVDQMVSSLPGALRDAARGEPAAVERDAVAAREPDDQRNRRRDVASRRHPAATQEREGVVDRLSLHDAVQIEDYRIAAQEETASQRDRVEPGDDCRYDRDFLGRQSVEVAVVAGPKERRTDGRGHQAAGGASRVECEAEHRREHLRDRRQPTGRGVDAVELGGFDKPAEPAVALVEERVHLVERRAVGDPHLAPHGADTVHHPPLWTLGALDDEDGPIEPPPSKPNESSSLNELSSLNGSCELTSVVAAGEPPPWVAGCASRTASPKRAKATAAAAPIE